MNEESQLQSQIVDLSRLLRLRVHHCRAAQIRPGVYATPIQGDAGFPDLVIAGRNGVLFRELKSRRGNHSTEQGAWISLLGLAGADTATWRPSDWPDRIRTELKAIT